MSIRDVLAGIFRRKPNSLRVTDGGGGYTWDTTKNNYALMRELYSNTNDNYKLGAAFAAPVVNATAGFMGVPNFRAEDETAQEILDQFSLNYTSEMLQTVIDALHLGDAYVWLTREERADSLFPEETGGRIVFNRIPPEEVKEVTRNPLTKEVEEYLLESRHEWQEDNAEKSCLIRQRISAGLRVIEIEGDKPKGVEPGEYALPWDFLPIVHFRNNPDSNKIHGRSELEALAPYMRAYHDVLLSALKGSKLHSTPKLSIFTRNQQDFMMNNFPDAKLQNDGSYLVDFKGKEMFFFMDKDQEGAEFIEAKNSIGAANDILKKLFYCIVDVSETPEFIFGVHTPAALASVKEQMPILINKIRRKREQYTAAWMRLARMVVVMETQGKGIRLKNASVSVEWDVIDPRDTTSIADTLRSTVEAMVKAVNNGLLSEETAMKYLSNQIESMQEAFTNSSEVTGERERIARDRRTRLRFQDREGFAQELNDIDRLLAEARSTE